MPSRLCIPSKFYDDDAGVKGQTEDYASAIKDAAEREALSTGTITATSCWRCHLRSDGPTAAHFFAGERERCCSLHNYSAETRS